MGGVVAMGINKKQHNVRAGFEVYGERDSQFIRWSIPTWFA